MKNLIKISIITILLLVFSISYIYAIDMNLTNEPFQNNTNNLEVHKNTIDVENELYEETNTKSEVLTTR